MTPAQMKRKIAAQARTIRELEGRVRRLSLQYTKESNTKRSLQDFRRRNEQAQRQLRNALGLLQESI